MSNDQLSTLLPLGLLATRKWLLSKGVSVHTLDNWVKSKKLIALARGVFVRAGGELTWQGVVVSLNRMSSTPVYVGGLSALEKVEPAQNIQEFPTVTIYSFDAQPSWLQSLALGVRFEWHNAARSWEAEKLRGLSSLRAVDWHEDLPAYWQARSEQAMVEVLDGVPNKVSFERADQLMRRLVILPPQRVDALMLACRSVKLKRSFLWLARRYQFVWYKRLAIESYDLGSGKRMIAKAGKLDREFLITVPADLHESA